MLVSRVAKKEIGWSLSAEATAARIALCRVAGSPSVLAITFMPGRPS